VDSVLLQKDADWELIVVDDGSRDNTDEILSRYAGEPRLRIIRQENRGVSAARNVGAGLSRGGWLAFLDSDDEWLPGKLAAQAARFSQPGFRIQQTREIWYRNSRRVNPPLHLLKKSGDIFEASLQRCMITPSSVCIERNLFEAYGGFDESFPACEDYELWLRITACHPVGLIDEEFLIRYGGHADQLSATVPALDAFRIRAMWKLLSKGALKKRQREVCLKTLRQKISIYRVGCRKRGREEELQWLNKIEAASGSEKFL
jgi:glycosyltransferase involved in cell wall biosynthesis